MALTSLNMKPKVTVSPGGDVNVEIPPSTAGSAENKFAPKVILPPRLAPKTWGGEDMVPEPLRIFMFGPAATGKTYAIYELLKAGFKVLYVSTDAGGMGLRSFIAELKRDNPELLKNFKGLTQLEYFEDVQTFVYNPTKIMPTIWEFDPDWLYFDGFTTWQQVMLSDKIYGGESAKVDERITENKEWSLIKNGTINMMSRLCKMSNPVTGKVLHKIISGHEDVRNPKNDIASTSTPNTDGIPTGTPWISGAAKQLVSTAVDIVIRTGYDRTKTKEKALGFRYYLDGAKNKMPKKRGKTMRDMPDDIPGNIMDIVNPIFTEEGITIGMVDPLNIAPQPVAVPVNTQES